MQAAREPPFILGLTMAGAISAGAYSAGVFDFLIQALEEWEKAKAADDKAPEHERRVPSHRLTIPVISGASAGGITAALGILAVGAGDRLAKVEANFVHSQKWESDVPARC
jgi:predicted acylesterase/phospholipase RssA